MDIKLVFSIFLFFTILVYYLSVNNEDRFYVTVPVQVYLNNDGKDKDIDKTLPSDKEEPLDIEIEEDSPLFTDAQTTLNINHLEPSALGQESRQQSDSEEGEESLITLDIDENALYLIKNAQGGYALTMSKQNNIKVKTASYGLNCGADKGNATYQLAQACDNKPICRYHINKHSIGDPAFDCDKNYMAEYSCGDRNRDLNVSPDASGKNILLSCDKSLSMVNTKSLITNQASVFRFVKNRNNTFTIDTVDKMGRVTISSKHPKGADDRYPIFVKQGDLNRTDKHEHFLFQLIKNPTGTVSIISAEGKGILSFWDSNIWAKLPFIYNIDGLAVCMYTGSECHYQNCEFTLTKIESLDSSANADADADEDKDNANANANANAKTEPQTQNRDQCDRPWAQYTLRNGQVSKKPFLD